MADADADAPPQSPPHLVLNLHPPRPSSSSESPSRKSQDTISSLAAESDAAYELASDDYETEAESRAFLRSSTSEQARKAFLSRRQRQQQEQQQGAEDGSRQPFTWKQKLVPCLFLVLLCYLAGFGPNVDWQADMKWSLFGHNKSGASSSAATTGHSSTQGMRNIAYFVNWAIYGRKYRPQDLPAQDLTHVLYAFANVRPESGEVYLSDAWADEQIHWEGDSWNDQGTNLYGCFKQLYLLKKQHPHLKVLLSIGGWTYSSNFAPMAATPHGRAAFARTATQLVETYGLDGLDVDWEYPENDRQAADYVELLKETRLALDQLARSKNESAPYELSIAAPGAPSKYEILRVKEMDQHLSFWNLMLYDFAGSWDSVAGHSANLHPVSTSPFAGDKAISYYHKKGVAKDKIVVGMPLYGRSFMNTDGPGAPYSGVGQGSWEQGVWDYKALPQPGSKVFEDRKAGASYSYNPSTREMVSYDTPNMGYYKAHWIAKEKLGGAMFWESSADFPQGHPDRMIGRVAKELFERGKDQTPNHLQFPGSKFENLRKGMQ